MYAAKVAPSRWRSRVREVSRRFGAGFILLLAAGVGLGDDLRSAPEARLGAREVQLDLPHIGSTSVQIPRARPTGVVLFLHRAGSIAERTALASAVPGHVVLVDVDTTRLGAADAADCRAAADLLEDVSRRGP